MKRTFNFKSCENCNKDHDMDDIINVNDYMEFDSGELYCISCLDSINWNEDEGV